MGSGNNVLLWLPTQWGSCGIFANQTWPCVASQFWRCPDGQYCESSMHWDSDQSIKNGTLSNGSVNVSGKKGQWLVSSGSIIRLHGSPRHHSRPLLHVLRRFISHMRMIRAGSEVSPWDDWLSQLKLRRPQFSNWRHNHGSPTGHPGSAH